jgi:predicted RNA-binding Zn ribbon-like protein
MQNQEKAERHTYTDHFALIGSRLAVDFVNTAPVPERSEDRLLTWSDLINFFAAAGTVSVARRESLISLDAAAPEETAAMHRAAIGLREAIRKILDARVAGVPLDPGCIARINEVLAHTEGYDRLEPAQDAATGGSDWRIALAARSQGLEWLLAAIARSAAGIVAEGPGAPVRRCANPKCGLFFYDDSRTRQRRWCSMRVCGNRSKVAAHFKRKRARAS